MQQLHRHSHATYVLCKIMVLHAYCQTQLANLMVLLQAHHLPIMTAKCQCILRSTKQAKSVGWQTGLSDAKTCGSHHALNAHFHQ